MYSDDVTLWQASVDESRAHDALTRRLNEGVLPSDPKVPVLKLIGVYARAVERRKAIEIRDAVLERIPSA